jgi:parallel beta-helix repeat protein
MFFPGRVRLAILVLTGGVAAATGVAASVGCGTVVDEQLVLDRDLSCAGTALIVRNPRTVVQLNGHVIESSRSCADGAPPAGIAIESSADGAQILGPGLIRGFKSGIGIADAARVQVRDLRISNTCANAVFIVGSRDVRIRNLILHRNGASALHAESAERLRLEASDIFLNGSASESPSPAVDLSGCVDCRIATNRITHNRGAGIHLDVESHGNDVERNVVLDHRPHDVVDEGSDNTFVLNTFERGDGVSPPALEPLTADPGPAAPGVVGCGVMADILGPRRTGTVACPQDPGLRGLRNSVVAYRLLLGSTLYGGDCDTPQILPAGSSRGGAVRCTNPSPIWNLILEVTCCLN